MNKKLIYEGQLIRKRKAVSKIFIVFYLKNSFRNEKKTPSFKRLDKKMMKEVHLFQSNFD